MPGPLTNARHERFVQEVAKGKSWTDAFEQAGFVRSSKNAARLAGRADVKARLAEIQEKAAEKVIVSVADIARQLDEDREFARLKNQPGAAVSATMGKAKVLGLLEDRTKVDITTAGKPLGLRDFYGNLPPPDDSDD
jgi:phage terminase small subunit